MQTVTIHHEGTPDPICPWCGANLGEFDFEHFGTNGTERFTCDNCGHDSVCKPEFDITYYTRKYFPKEISDLADLRKGDLARDKYYKEQTEFKILQGKAVQLPYTFAEPTPLQAGETGIVNEYCPHGVWTCRVGSVACKLCEHHFHQDRNKQFVICEHPRKEETTNAES